MAIGKKRLVGSLLVAVVTVLLSPGVFALPDRPENFEHNDVDSATKWLDRYVDAWMGDESIPGVSVSLVDNGKTLWSKGFGYANVEDQEKIKPDTVFRVGGVTTLFTATAIMQLREQGKLDLDDPLKKYLPGFNTKTHWKSEQPITIRQLLSHHSGLPIAVYKGMWAKHPQGLKSVLDYIENNYTAHPPGEIYAFSNLGYVLLGMVIEQVSGLHYEDYIQKNIIEPLQLKNTGFQLTPQLKSHLAQGYKKDEPRELLFPRDVPALGLYSTTEDMAKFIQSFGGVDAVLSQESRALMLTVQNKDNPWDMERSVGLGWHLDEKRLYKAGPMAARWGSTLMYRSRVLFAPTYGLSVVVNANSSKAFRAIDEIAIEAMRTALEVRYGVKHDLQKDEQLKLAPVSNAAEFENEYVTMAGYANIRKSGEDYVTRILGWNVRLVPQGNGWYSAQYDFLGFLPIKLDWFAKTRIAPATINGEPTLITYVNGKKSVFGSQLDKGSVNQKWFSRIGEYAIANSDELMDFYNVQTGKLWAENGRIFFSYDIPVFLSTSVTLPIVPISDDLAIIPGKASAFNETLQIVERNGKERILFSGYELEKPEETAFWKF